MNELEGRLQREVIRAEKAEAMLRSAMCLIHGLCCPGCGQGRELAPKCCKDIDCDAGWFGVDADAIKDFLEAADALMPGTLAAIENPPEPINEASDI